MNSLLAPDAILFDMDGVLVDSFNSWWHSLNKILLKEKDKKLTRDDFLKNFWGDTLQENLKKLEINTNNYSFCNNFYNQYVKYVSIFPHTKKVLETLQQYPLGLITNTPRQCTMRILKRFNIKMFFKVIITSDQIEKGKPEPDMIFSACQKLKVEPKKSIVVGDTQNDIQAGKKAGCITVGINTNADFRIKNIKQLPDLIENNKITD